MYAVGTGGYGTASSSLLIADPGAAYPTTIDANGNYYITTDSSGNFHVAGGEYTCSVGQQVYLYSIGGNTGSGVNPSAGLLMTLGTCEAGGSFPGVTNVVLNEVSTIATAYAFAQYATDATDIGSANTTLALTGAANATATAANMFNINRGASAEGLAVTPAGNGTVPQAELNTLGNILAACVNSTGASSTPCSTLFSNAMSNGSTGTTPTDTATAAINIAHHPAANVSNLFSIPSSVVPFSPYLSSAPNDFTISISYSDSSLDKPSALAVDASGNVWVANSANATHGATPVISVFSNTGAILSGTGYTNTDMTTPSGIAIDNSGNAWVSDEYGYIYEFSSVGSTETTISYATNTHVNYPVGVGIDFMGNVWVAQGGTTALEFNSSGTEAATSPVSGGGLNNDVAVALDALGNAFFANSPASSPRSVVSGEASEFTALGIALSGSSGYGSSLALNGTNGIALDSSDNVWMTSANSSSLTEITASSLYVTATNYSAPGLSSPEAVAIDGAQDIWVADDSGSVIQFAPNGTAISGSNGYEPNISLQLPTAIAIDGSGNVWVTNSGNSKLTEVIGAATPVVTPMAADISITGSYRALASKP